MPAAMGLLHGVSVISALALARFAVFDVVQVCGGWFVGYSRRCACPALLWKCLIGCLQALCWCSY